MRGPVFPVRGSRVSYVDGVWGLLGPLLHLPPFTGSPSTPAA